MKIGINIDHIATLRQARKEDEPNLVTAAKEVIAAGAEQITIHLREDRRHIQDQDVYDIKKLPILLNLEMAVSDEIIKIACDVQPDFACLVPEKREELTTEGGLNVIKGQNKIKAAIQTLHQAGIKVSIFIDPDLGQIKTAKSIGAEYIEIHTGAYANATDQTQEKELKKIKQAATYAKSIGLTVNAGHGLKYYNVLPIANIPEIEELNIGHSIICKAIFVGLKNAVLEMKSLITR